MDYEMNIENEVKLLSIKLRKYPSFVGIGQGKDDHNRDVIFIYVTSEKDFKEEALELSLVKSPYVIEETGVFSFNKSSKRTPQRAKLSLWLQH